MAAIPCPIKAPCLDDANPVQNLSSEAPDVNHFFAYGSGPGSILSGRTTGPGGVGPNPGGNWSDSCETPNGPAVCVAETQEEADLCVARLAQQCTPNPDDPTPTTPTTPSGDPLFSNTLQQCTASCPDGSPFTFQVAAGLFVAISQVLADREANSYACRQAQLLKVCFGSLSSNSACVGQSYFATVTVSGGAGFNASITGGSLPPGITMSSTGSTVLLSGTPTTPGNYTFSIRVVNARGNFMVKSFTVFVLGFTNGQPPPPSVTIAYSFQLTASGGASPYTFALSSGALPVGLTVSSGGLISGTPTTAGTSTFGITTTDSSGRTCAVQYSLNATIPAGFIICDWATVVLPLLDVAGCPASAAPAWNGIFNLQTSDPANPGSVIWYFIGQSILGKSVAANETPDYPAGPWQGNDCFSNLFFDPIAVSWNLNIACSNCAGVFSTWIGSSVNPADPTGQYTRAAGTGPDIIQVRNTTDPCCPDSGNLIAPTYNIGIQPARVRIKDMATFRSQAGTCAVCDNSGDPAWDGTLTVQFAPNNTTLNYYPTGSTNAALSTLPALSFNGKKISNGIGAGNWIVLDFDPPIGWRIRIFCFEAGNPGIGTIWVGLKGVGSDPAGVYTDVGSSTVGAHIPCVTIESF